MGMSASQMRYCMISGKKSDVEFQGQQINQQRTTLATQSSAYNTQLLNIKVPTPPSSSEYSKTAYTYTSNGETRTIVGSQFQTNPYYIGVNGETITGNNPTAGGTTYPAGTYVVNYTTNSTSSQGKSSGTSTFASTTDTTVVPNVTTYQTNTGTALSRVVTNPATAGYNATDVSNTALITKDCALPANTAYFKYESSAGVTKYVTEADLIAQANSTTPISTYFVDNEAKNEKSSSLPGAKVAWNETGRMTSVTDQYGNKTTLSVTTKSDDVAYNDAFQEYQYKKGLYDQEMNNINSQIEIIASQDKKLELKLQDLDTQQQALSTEMDSVKKVIDKNIESSFKAFA